MLLHHLFLTVKHFVALIHLFQPFKDCCSFFSEWRIHNKCMWLFYRNIYFDFFTIMGRNVPRMFRYSMQSFYVRMHNIWECHLVMKAQTFRLLALRHFSHKYAQLVEIMARRPRPREPEQPIVSLWHIFF